MSGRRFEEAGFKRMMRRRWNGRAQGNDAGVERPGPRKAPGLFGGVGSWWCAVKSCPLGHMYSVQA